MIGLLVRETILLKRAYDCEHEWSKLNDTEDQCCKCSVIATEDGKRNLERIARSVGVRQ